MRVFPTLFLLCTLTLSASGGLYAHQTDIPEFGSSAVNLSRSSGNVAHPQIAFTSDILGIVYQDSVTGGGDIFYVQSQDGGNTFLSPENISTSADPSHNPSIAMQGNRTCIAWEEGNGRILARGRTDPSVAFSSPVLISSAASLAYGVQVLIRDGKFYAFFAQVEQGIKQIFVNASEDGGRTWSKEPAKAISTQGNVRELHAVLNSAGEIALIWLEETGTRIKLNSAVSPGGITFAQTQTLSIPQGGTPLDIQVVTSGIRILVGWTQARKTKSRVHFALYTIAGGVFETVTASVPAGTFSPSVALTDTTAYIGWVKNPEDRAFVSASENIGPGDFQPAQPATPISTTINAIALAASQETLFLSWQRKLAGGGKRLRFDIAAAASTDQGASFSIFPPFSAPVKQLAQPPKLVPGKKRDVLVIWVDTTPQSNDQIFLGHISL